MIKFKNGYLVEGDEDENGIVKDGHSVRVPLEFTDSARIQAIKDACMQRNKSMSSAIVDEHQAYDRRISNAWRTAGVVAETAMRDEDVDVSKLTLDQQHDRYDRRISNAWKQPSPAPQSRQAVTNDAEAERQRYQSRIANAWRG